jgi:hypothetical protein
MSLVTANIILVLRTMSRTEAHIKIMRSKLNNNEDIKVLN